MIIIIYNNIMIILYYYIIILYNNIIEYIGLKWTFITKDIFIIPTEEYT